MSPSIKFTIYDAHNGIIHRSGESNCAQPLAACEALLEEVIGNPRTQRVDVTATPPVLVDL